MKIIYKERSTEFLQRLESPRSSRYAYRLIEITLRDATDHEITDLEVLREIVANAHKDLRIWDHFDVYISWDDDVGVDTEDIFINDIFLSQKRYTVVFEIYVVPWAKLNLFFDNLWISIVHKDVEATEEVVETTEG